MANIANFRIPVSWDKNSPTFYGKCASALRRFLHHMGTIITVGGITNEAEKKDKSLEYISNQDIVEQWERLPSYTTGSYEDWVKEIEELFPELEDAKAGSREKLDKICEEYQDISVTEPGLVQHFSLAFTNEAEKLKKAPAAIENGQLVDMYLDCFEDSFAGNIRTLLIHSKLFGPQGTNPVAAVAGGGNAVVPAAGNVVRRGDKIPLEEVVKLAIKMAENWGQVTTNPRKKEKDRSTSVEVKLEDSSATFNQALDEAMAALTAKMMDGFVVQDKKLEALQAQTTFNQKVRERPPHQEAAPNNFDNTQNDRAPSGNNGNNGGFGGNPGYNHHNHNSSNDHQGCWYCNQEHLMINCPFKLEHIEMGYIIVENGYMKLGTGNRIPRYPDYKSKKERVDNYWFGQGKKKVSPIPMAQNLVNTPMGFNQDNYGNSGDQLTQVYNFRDDELRAMRVQLAVARGTHPNFNQIQIATPVAPAPVPVTVPQFIQVPMPVNNGNMDSQLVNLVDSVRRGTNAEQFVATRTGAKSDGPGNPNF
jgi:hypothetical protein